MPTESTSDVVIIGAGPAGMLLSVLLRAQGISTVVIESRSIEHVLGRIRAGMLEHRTVQLLIEAGVGDRLQRIGMRHSGVQLHWPGERFRIDFDELAGYPVWVYGQSEIQQDLVNAHGTTDGFFDQVSSVQLNDLDSARPSVSFLDADQKPHRITAQAIAGCDGSMGPSRPAVPQSHQKNWSRQYPFSWLGILANVAPSSDELIYAWNPDGFALHSMRSESVSRFYLQVPNDTKAEDWSDDRIWDALARRLGSGFGDWSLAPGPITDRGVFPVRSRVSIPMRYGQLFLAGDAAHQVPPTGAKGLNLAVSDIQLLAPALVELITHKNHALVDGYQDAALRRVWRATHFSWAMTAMLHSTGDEFEDQLQLAQLRWIARNRSAAQSVAQDYVGLAQT